LFEASGSAGKVMIFAVRLDTFEKDKETRVFYIGTNDPAELTNLRRAILGNFAHLPVAGEYMHRTCFDIAARYGKDTYLAIRKLGTDRIPGLFAAKARIDGLSFMPAGLTDKVIQFISDLLPSHLPPRLVEWRDRYEHHLILRMADDGIAEAARWLGEHFPSATGSFFECTPEEAEGAFLHRFAAAGAANRYRAVHNHKVENIVALDIALPRNCEDWVEHLPPRSSSRSCTSSITAISCAMCSIRTISWPRAPIAWLWRTRCCPCWTGGGGISRRA
jgi:D-lactate dehydrogenase